MFMRGQMTQRNVPPGMVLAHVHKIEWKVDAVVNDDSKKFAEELQALLNSCTEEGYAVSHMLTRDSDKGFVVIHQRHLIEAPATEMPVEPAPGREN